MRRLLLTLVTVSAISMVFFGTAAAEENSGIDRVVIVDFDTVNVDTAVMDNFYGYLRSAIADDSTMEIESSGSVSMGDLLLMAGCDSPSPECLSMLRDFIDGDHILFGSVQRSDDVHMFTLELFDFEAGESLREVSEQTLRGDDEWLADGIPAVIEHFMHGETASLHIEVRGYDNAEVKLNGNVVGSGTTTVSSLPPGEVVVSVTGADGTEHQERLILRHERESEVEFDVAPSVAGIDTPGEGAGSMLLPGLGATGVGVVGLVVGLIGQSQLSSSESEANTLVGGQGAIESNNLARAHQLQDDMNSANTMRIVGFTTGAVGLAAGGTLLFMALTGSADQAPAHTERGFDLDLGASTDGFNAGFRLQF